MIEGLPVKELSLHSELEIDVQTLCALIGRSRGQCHFLIHWNRKLNIIKIIQMNILKKKKKSLIKVQC